MWAMIKDHPWTFGIGAMILVAAIVGVVIGIKFKGFWKDRGLMKTKDGKPIHWALDVLPIPLLFHPSLPQTYVESIRAVSKEVDAITGNQIFDLGTYADPNLINFEKPPRNHVLIRLGEDTLTGSTALTWDERSGELRTALIDLPPRRYAVIGKVIKHELGGHSLGFDHDEQTSSIMHPALQNRPQYFTAQDVKLRKQYYGGKEPTDEG